MSTFYVLVHDEVYNIYQTREKAEIAKKFYLEKYLLKDCSKSATIYNKSVADSIKITAVEEGHAFGDGLRVDHATTQDIIVED